MCGWYLHFIVTIFSFNLFHWAKGPAIDLPRGPEFLSTALSTITSLDQCMHIATNITCVHTILVPGSFDLIRGSSSSPEKSLWKRIVEETVTFRLG